MYYIDAYAKSGKNKFAKKLTALIICSFFLAGSIFSVASVFNHISHEHGHIGSDLSCAICLHLTVVENLLKFLASVIAVAALAIGCLNFILSLLKNDVQHTDFPTLLNQKIRFNN